MGMSGLILLGLSLLGQAKPAVIPETAADVVILRDGAAAYGQIVEPAPRGTMILAVRRDWAKTKLPEWSKRWTEIEKPQVRRAVAQRKDRLAAWKQERARSAQADDPILRWIDSEAERLSKPEEIPPSTLMVVKLNRSDVRSIQRRTKASARMLRQAWLSHFRNAEEMPLPALRDALEARGFLADGQGEASVERLLPLMSETDARWLARRAATEVANDSGLRFLQTQGLVLPEPPPGQGAPITAATSAIGQLGRLLSDAPNDPLADSLREVAERGRVGAVVTRLDVSPDLSAVRVESILLARDHSGRWLPATTRWSVVRPEEAAAGAGKQLEEDPQIKVVFKVAESLGLGQIPDSVKQRSLNMGAATQKALGQTRSALIEDLTALELPVGDVAPADADPKKPVAP